MFTLKSKLNISKGGEKMKTLGLMLALVVVLASASFAATIDIYTGFNCVAIPNVAIDSAPESVLSGASLDGYLSRFDAAGGSDVTYSAWAPEEFGGMLLGEGYWLSSDTTADYTYSGLDNGVPSAGVKTDMWISLPGNQYDGLDQGGWHLIGNPYAELVNKSNLYFTDGKDLLSWEDANSAGWVGGELQGFDGMYQSSYIISLSWGDGDDLIPARGYYLQTFKDNLAMIVVAP